MDGRDPVTNFKKIVDKITRNHLLAVFFHSIFSYSYTKCLSTCQCHLNDSSESAWAADITSNMAAPVSSLRAFGYVHKGGLYR